MSRYIATMRGCNGLWKTLKNFLSMKGSEQTGIIVNVHIPQTGDTVQLALQYSSHHEQDVATMTWVGFNGHQKTCTMTKDTLETVPNKFPPRQRE